MKDLIEKALKRSPGGFTLADVLGAINRGTARLWPGKRSVAVTETTRTFHIWLAAGEMRELMEMLEAGEAEYRALGYDAVTITEAREGWKRALRARGYVEKTFLVKEL